MVRRPQATENVAQPRQRGCFQQHLVNWTPHALVGTSQDRGSRTGKVEKKERRISRRTGSMGADHRTQPEKRAKAGGSFLCHSLESQHAFSHRHTSTKDAHLIVTQAHLNIAWPQHRITRLHHHRRPRDAPAKHRQVAGRRAHTWSCWRNFDNTLGGCASTRMSLSSVINRIEAKQIAALPINGAKLLEETMRVWLSTLDRYPVA